MLAGCATEMMGSKSRPFPRSKVAWIKAGGGAAPAEICQRRGGQEKEQREGDGAERKAGHECIIPRRFVWYNDEHGQCDDFRAAGGPGLGGRDFGGD